MRHASGPKRRVQKAEIGKQAAEHGIGATIHACYPVLTRMGVVIKKALVCDIISTKWFTQSKFCSLKSWHYTAIFSQVDIFNSFPYS